MNFSIILHICFLQLKLKAAFIYHVENLRHIVEVTLNFLIFKLELSALSLLK